MFIVGLLSWWYGEGWRQRGALLRDHLTATADYFSLDLLARTLFSPFRQISAGGVRGPLGVQLRAFLDRLISRCIGAMIRMTIMIIGGISLALSALIGGILVVGWVCVPALPAIGCLMWVTGWMPWR